MIKIFLFLDIYCYILLILIYSYVIFEVYDDKICWLMYFRIYDILIIYKFLE